MNARTEMVSSSSNHASFLGVFESRFTTLPFRRPDLQGTAVTATKGAGYGIAAATIRRMAKRACETMPPEAPFKLAYLKEWRAYTFSPWRRNLIFKSPIAYQKGLRLFGLVGLGWLALDGYRAYRRDNYRVDYEMYKFAGRTVVGIVLGTGAAMLAKSLPISLALGALAGAAGATGGEIIAEGVYRIRSTKLLHGLDLSQLTKSLQA